jgi:hypothetical protein
MLRIFLATLAILLLMTCGGGSSNDPIAPPVIARQDLLVGYYNINDDIVGVKDHVNIIFEHGWPTGDLAIQHLMQAKANGIKYAILDAGNNPDSLRWTLQQMQTANVLDMILILAAPDEMDVNNYTEEQANKTILDIKKVASSFLYLKDSKILCIYGNTGRTPGINNCDVVARDNYGHGPQMIELTNNKQTRGLVSGCVSPYNERPQLYQQALQDSNTSIFIIFLWEWPDRHPGGCKDNGLADVYRTFNQQLLGLK